MRPVFASNKEEMALNCPCDFKTGWYFKRNHGELDNKKFLDKAERRPNLDYGYSKWIKDSNKDPMENDVWTWHMKMTCWAAGGQTIAEDPPRPKPLPKPQPKICREGDV